MTDKRDVERPYTVDGIKEYDNPLPSWWVLLFYSTIAFAPLYLLYIHLFDGNTLMDELSRDKQKHAAFISELANQRVGEGGSLVDRMRDPDYIAAGASIYATNCAPCHGAGGEGTVGPNLADDYWIHGGSAEDILRVITEGVPEKGMIAWQGILSPQRLEEVTAFVMSLRGNDLPNAKAPEGELYEGWDIRAGESGP